MNLNALGLISTYMATLSHQVEATTYMYEIFYGHLEKEVVVGVTCWNLKSH
jgi:hypothetical protein